MHSKSASCRKHKLSEPLFGRMKRIQVYENGEPRCYILNIVPRNFRSWNAVLQYITNVIRPNFGPVKRLLALRNCKCVETFEELESREKYVALGFSGSLKMIPGGYRDLCRQKGCKQLYCGQLNSEMSCFIKETKKKGLTIIYVVRNGISIQVPKKIVFRKQDLESWDLILRFLSKKLDIPEGAAFVCTIFGEMLCDPRELQHGYVYVVIPYQEDFVKMDYLQCFQYMCGLYRRNYVVNIKPAACKRSKKYRSRRRYDSCFLRENTEDEKVLDISVMPCIRYQTNDDENTVPCTCVCSPKKPCCYCRPNTNSNLVGCDTNNNNNNFWDKGEIPYPLCTNCMNINSQSNFSPIDPVFEKLCFCGTCCMFQENIYENVNSQSDDECSCNGYDIENCYPEPSKLPLMLNKLTEMPGSSSNEEKICECFICPGKTKLKSLGENDVPFQQIDSKTLEEGCFYKQMTGKSKNKSICCPKRLFIPSSCKTRPLSCHSSYIESNEQSNEAVLHVQGTYNTKKQQNEDCKTLNCSKDEKKYVFEKTHCLNNSSSEKLDCFVNKNRRDCRKGIVV